MTGPGGFDDSRQHPDVDLREPLQPGDRVGRFVILRYVNGMTHAVATGSVAAICETEEGVFVMLSGGRVVHVLEGIETVLRWLGGHGS